MIQIPEGGGGGGGGGSGGSWLAYTTIAASTLLSPGVFYAVDHAASVILTLPVAVAGSRIGVRYAAAVAGNAITWAGPTLFGQEATLFIPNETLILVSTGAQWAVEADGRIPHVALITKSAAQSITSGLETNIDANITQLDNGLIVSGTTSKQITPIRQGVYRVWSTVVLDGLTDGKWMSISVGRDGSSAARHNPLVWSSSAGAEKRCSINAEITLDWPLGDSVYWTVQHNQGAAISTLGTGPQSPKMGIREELSRLV